MNKTSSIQIAAPQEIEIDGQRIAYNLICSKSAKKLRVRIGPRGMTVVLPPGRDIAEVAPFLSENPAWITEQLARMETLRSIRRSQTRPQGEMLYLGEPKTVMVEERASLRGTARVRLRENQILIVRSPSSQTSPQKSLENWLRKQARLAIEAELAAVTRKLDCKPNGIYLMDQRTKWGNCSSRGNLSFNWRLILAPPFVLRYLVTHEAAHLAVPDHSKKFWLTVQSLCPETERARQWLCANSERLRPDMASLFAPKPTS